LHKRCEDDLSTDSTLPANVTIHPHHQRTAQEFINTSTMADRDSEDDFTIGEDFVASPERKAPQTSRINFDGVLQPGVVLHQDLANGNGGQAWPAGMVLTKYLLRKKRDEMRGASMSVGEHRCLTILV